MSLKKWLLTILAVSVVGLGVGVLAVGGPLADAASSNGWTTTVSVSRTQVERGSAVTVTVNVASNKTTNALVDVEIYNGSTKSFQWFSDGQSFAPNVSRQFTATWTVPANEPTTVHVVKVGVFGPGWNGVAHWNDDAARITVPLGSVDDSRAANNDDHDHEADDDHPADDDHDDDDVADHHERADGHQRVDDQCHRGPHAGRARERGHGDGERRVEQDDERARRRRDLQRVHEVVPVVLGWSAVHGERQPSAHGDVDGAGERGDDCACRQGGRLRAGLERHCLLERRCRSDHRGRFGRVDDDPAAGDDDNGEADDDHPADDDHDNGEADDDNGRADDDDDGRAHDHPATDNRSFLHAAARIGPAI